ncbi:MAG: hypothetical protein ACYCU0_04515 [Solirubrobacteraceae bacterium]
MSATGTVQRGPAGALADLLVGALASEIAQSEVLVFAVTSPASAVAALAARELGATRLAIAGGFTALDATPVPNVSLGEAGLLSAGPAFRDEPFDTFTLLARGRVGVATAPAQLDASGRTNLSGIGPPGTPKVALPGCRGLPDNNHSPSHVWYVLPAHSPRQLVERVDVVCGAEPPASTIRRLLSPAGCFELRDRAWHACWLTPAAPKLLAATPGFVAELTGAEPVRETPRSSEAAALARVDPWCVREIEFAGGAEAARLWARAAEREAA